MKRSAKVVITFALLFFARISYAIDIQKIQNQAIENKLWEDPYWHKLIHYQKRNFGGYISHADGPNFYLSADGKKNPKSELLKNIESLFADPKTFIDPNDQSACKFPGRYTWLREKLMLAVPAQDDLNCPDFQEWKKALGAQGVSLIFASSYTNNPASMFGHTFLRMHRVKDGKELPAMLHYTVNFAAETGKEKGMLYTIKGLFGFYPGYFSTFPYYIKIQQYNNFEARDLWEYDMKISSEQLQRIVDHMWEMGSTYFPYYFADENCSYFLLALMEMADDSTQLLKHLPFFTIPIDTLKIVDHDTDWLTNINFRPSLQRRYEAGYRSLDHRQKKVFDNLVKNQNPDILQSETKDSTARILDTSLDFLAMKEKQSAKTDFQKTLLKIRSQDPVNYEKPNVDQPANPLASHPTLRIGAGYARLASENWADLDFRGAYHDLLDDPDGFDPGAQIQSMEGRIRFSTERNQVTLDHLKLIEVLSLNPYKKYLYKPSWNVGFGWRQNYSDECFDCGAFYIEGGPGVTFGNSIHRRLYLTFFADGFFQAGPWNHTDYQIGPAGVGILTVDFTHWLRIDFRGDAHYTPIGNPNFNYTAKAEGVVELNKQWSIRSWYDLYSTSHEFGGTLLYYF